MKLNSLLLITSLIASPAAHGHMLHATECNRLEDDALYQQCHSAVVEHNRTITDTSGTHSEQPTTRFNGLGPYSAMNGIVPESLIRRNQQQNLYNTIHNLTNGWGF